MLPTEDVVQYAFSCSASMSSVMVYSVWFTFINHPDLLHPSRSTISVDSNTSHFDICSSSKSRLGFPLLKNLSYSCHAYFGSFLGFFGERRQIEEAMRKVLDHRQTHRLTHVSQFLGKGHRVVQQGVQSGGLWKQREKPGNTVNTEKGHA